ncbi:MAG: hypothetical protein Q8O52_05465 [Sulfuritalea sp.]|nr:hypothetical protein [Sulfuritalea sp.]
MSKPAATTVSSCRMHVGWLSAAVYALTLLSSSVVVAATPDISLRRSEELDTRRLGRVSENERSVLRVEWRAALTGAEEARTVQDVLDSLRRMESTIREINRLIGNLPAQKPVIQAVAVEPPESADRDFRLALATGAAAGLLAIWWFRRRNSAKHPGAKAALDMSPEANPPVAASPAGTVPTMAPPAETPPAEEPARTPTIELPAAPPKPAAAESTAEPRSESRQIEPGAAAEAIKAERSPTPIAEPEVGQSVSARLTESRSPAPLPAAELPAIDFSLEDADPESVARENARMPVPRTNSRPRVPERRQEINIEPTLQLAEIMLSMGLEQGAAQALIEYTEANPRQAVYHWLKLLGIYRNGGHHKDFKETAEKLRQHFNIKAEDSAISSTGEAPTLENFSRVAQHVEQIWLQPKECMAYLQHLLEDNREGSRAGFPQSVAEEILLLIEVLKDVSDARQAAGT